MTKQEHPLPRFVACMPLIVGSVAVFISMIYEMQRSGIVAPRSLDRLVQQNLDGFAFASLILAGSGIALGLYLGCGGRRTRLLFLGAVVFAIGALSFFLLSL